MTLPVEDEDDENHYLAPSEARMKIESENLSLEKLKSYLPNTKNNTEEKKYIAERKKEDKSFVFDFTKVRATARCNYCGATRVIYSHKKVGVKDGPTVKDLEKLKSSLERNGYNCGDKITVGNFLCSSSFGVWTSNRTILPQSQHWNKGWQDSDKGYLCSLLCE